VNGVIV